MQDYRIIDISNVYKLIKKTGVGESLDTCLINSLFVARYKELVGFVDSVGLTHDNELWFKLLGKKDKTPTSKDLWRTEVFLNVVIQVFVTTMLYHGIEKILYIDEKRKVIVCE